MELRALLCVILAGAAAARRPGASCGGPGGGDAVSLLQASLEVSDPLNELKAGLPQLAFVDAKIKVAESDKAAQALARLADRQEEASVTNGQEEEDRDAASEVPDVQNGSNASGAAERKHRVTLDPRKFGDLFGQAERCCLENTSSTVHGRSHAVNRTRILEKLRQGPGVGENGKYVDPEVKEEIGEMIVKVNKVLDVLMRAGHRGNHPHLHGKVHPVHSRPGGLLVFFQSVAFFDWALLALFILIFFVMYSYMLGWKNRRLSHGRTLGVWLVMAVIFGLVIWLRQGDSSATLWVSGYILEFIFLIENVFVFHIVISAFKLSHRVLDNALFCVVGFQVAFQVVFYMGLASVLTHWPILPYVLGIWLLYVAYHAAFDDDHAEFNVMESRMVRGARWLLGKRLLTAHEADRFITKNANGLYCLTVGGLCVVFLVVADFLLEVDVTLAKIEGLGGVKIGPGESNDLPELEYICFSSSAVATFTVPELYFVARDIFARLRGLKYGIALVISYLGVQMLLGTVYTVPLLVDIAIFIGVLVVSGVTSVIVDNFYAMKADHEIKQSGHLKPKNVNDLVDARNVRHTWSGAVHVPAEEIITATTGPLRRKEGTPEETPEATPEQTPEKEEASTTAAGPSDVKSEAPVSQQDGDK